MISLSFLLFSRTFAVTTLIFGLLSCYQHNPKERVNKPNEELSADIQTASKLASPQQNIRSTLSEVVNDTQWRDNKGKQLKVGRGGKVGVIDAKLYWVGMVNNSAIQGPDIYLYESDLAAGGSNAWKSLGKIIDHPVGVDKGKNCQIEKMKSGTHPYRMFCKWTWYKSAQIDSGWMEIPFKADFSDIIPLCSDCANYNKIGAQSVYQRNGNLWWAAAINDLSSACKASVVFKFDKNWETLNKKNVFIPNDCTNNTAREAVSIMNYGGNWHMFSSGNHGWKPSNTYHRTAKWIYQLANAAEKQVAMYPNHRASPSHGSQYRQIFEIRPGKWAYFGERYPVEDSMTWHGSHGRRIITPVKWNGLTPNVYYKGNWNYDTYNYSSPTFDNHTHHGTNPDCNNIRMGHSCS